MACVAELTRLHGAHPQLRPVREGSEDWVSISRGWEADQDAAEAIAVRFNRHFEDRVDWVKSARNRRGEIGAECRVKEVGHFGFKLSWRNRTIGPMGPLDPRYHKAFRRASHEVMEWASRRIQPILDTLKVKLQSLYGDRLRGLYVFGSYARPDAGIELPEDSDLDVAVLLTDMESSYAEIEATSGISTDLSLEYGLAISLVHLREADFREGRTNFTRVISKYARSA